MMDTLQRPWSRTEPSVRQHVELTIRAVTEISKVYVEPRL